MKKFNISIHDITKTNMENVIKIIFFLEDLGIKKISLLLIPKYHNKEDILEIKDYLKDIIPNREIILHGFYHKADKVNIFNIKNRLFTSGEGEVLNLSLKEFENRLREGLKLLNSINLYPEGYIAPAWLIKKENIKLLKKYGFKFTTTRYGIYDLINNRYIFSPVISFSCRGIIESISVRTFTVQLKLYKSFLNFLRLAIHPCDINSSKKLNLIKTFILKMQNWGESSHFSELIGGINYDKSRSTSSFNSIK
ncbi:polysaccharide deacetylase family protein [Hydrogenothermus marinus]|uniref:DUF2334 domain-containing protein n=1 Tax=Hydrogenothermus marinus TaxID=133270 RepID=A0A3M0B7A6_9AQUI|nr:polysaccharide deacetylase family protein [Hydrogenothermus marinus]RMA92516.1 hypothetical protein CLV39_1673 [Hydrogenothermus marinus]